VVSRNLPEHDVKKFHFGFTLGINVMDFKIQPSDLATQNSVVPEVSMLVPGFNINIVSNLRINSFIDLRFLPGIGFGQRTVDYFLDLAYDSSQELESSYLEFPFMVKYKSTRLNNYRPYILTGMNFRYDLAKNFNEEDQLFLKLRPFDIYTELGFGIDFYLPYFRFSTEVKYAMGMRNILDKVNTSEPFFQDAASFFRSNILIISFHFE
jgi:hypothetical protein